MKKNENVYFMGSKYGQWFYDEGEEDITKAIRLESSSFHKNQKSEVDKYLKKS